jgi:succinate dehydrogenase flavin-adding protein (antitoxin of CptAB toxin-antitoxin module)
MNDLDERTLRLWLRYRRKSKEFDIILSSFVSRLSSIGGFYV